MNDIKTGSFIKILPYEEIVAKYDVEKRITYVGIPHGNILIYPLEVKLFDAYIVELI